MPVCARGSIGSGWPALWASVLVAAVLCCSPGLARASSLSDPFFGTAEPIFIGVVGAGAVLGAYALAGVDYQGILVPSEVAAWQLGLSAAACVGAGAWAGEVDDHAGPLALAVGGGLLAAHAAISLLGYEAPPAVAVAASREGSVMVVWRGHL